EEREGEPHASTGDRVWAVLPPREDSRRLPEDSKELSAQDHRESADQNRLEGESPKARGPMRQAPETQGRIRHAAGGCERVRDRRPLDVNVPRVPRGVVADDRRGSIVADREGEHSKERARRGVEEPDSRGRRNGEEVVGRPADRIERGVVAIR